MSQIFSLATAQGFTDRNCRQVSICGKEVILDPSGALFMPAAGTLVLSGLVMTGVTHRLNNPRQKVHHLTEKMTLLDDVLLRLRPDRIIALGGAPIRREDFSDLEGAAHEVVFSHFDEFEWHWVGPVMEQAYVSDLDIMAHEAIEIGGLTLRHRPLRGPVTHEIAGYFNPAAFVGAPGYAVRRPCFVSNGMRLILPRFGSYAGGENVLDKRFGSFFTDDGLQVWMIGYEGVQPVACRQLRGD